MDSDMVIVFDLDGTLTESKCVIDTEMAEELIKLLDMHRVAIITGGTFRQIYKQVLEKMPEGNHLDRLYLFPTNGTRALFHKTEMDGLYTDYFWRDRYREVIPKAERDRIKTAFWQAIDELNFELPKELWGPQLDDRTTQITYSHFGQKAPLDVKTGWDKKGKKRWPLLERLQELLPDFEIKLGGTTSIDINKRGIDKAYGIRKIAKTMAISEEKIVFVGCDVEDALKTKAITYEMLDPDETKQFIRRILNYEL